MCLRSYDYDDDVSDDSGEYYEGGVSFDDSELYEELLPRIKAAVQRHPERITQSIMTTARDHGMDSSNSDDDDSVCDEMDTLHFKLRNAVATGNGGGRPRAATRGNARFAAPFAAGLLLERGYILKRGDTELWLEWLESEPFDAPDDAMWRSLVLVRQTHHAGDRDAS